MELLRHALPVDPDVENDGHSALRAEIASAFEKTHDAICDDPQVQGCYFRQFVERLPDWDHIVVRYLGAKATSSGREAWRQRRRVWLKAKRYPEQLRREYLRGVERHASFLEKYALRLLTLDAFTRSTQMAPLQLFVEAIRSGMSASLSRCRDATSRSTGAPRTTSSPKVQSMRRIEHGRPVGIADRAETCGATTKR